MNHKLTIASRRSALALWQTHHVRDLLREQDSGLDIDVLELVTRGDRILDRPLAEIGGKGLFLKELERALLSGEADLAVHSFKDMPADDTPGLRVACVLPRANPVDAWLCRHGSSWSELPAGSVVGTSSLRRRGQLLNRRPDLTVRDLRGNVDTRLAKLQAGEYDAIILAWAGLERLGLADEIHAPLAAPEWVPAASQGAICIQIREDDAATAGYLSALHHAPTAVAVGAERAVAAALEASCEVPMGAYAELDGEQLNLFAMVCSKDGDELLRVEEHGPADEGVSLGRQAAHRLLDMGAADILGL